MMDIYEYIHKDHQAVANLMQQIVDSDDPDECATLFETIREELILHLGSEEQTFYEAVEKAILPSEVKREMSNAHHEHNEVRQYLEKLSTSEIASPGWMRTFNEMRKVVADHVAEEETDVWADARQVLTEADAHRLAIEMSEVKTQLKVRLESAQPILFASGQAGSAGILRE